MFKVIIVYFFRCLKSHNSILLTCLYLFPPYFIDFVFTLYHRSNLFVQCVFTRRVIMYFDCVSHFNWYLKVCLSMLWYYTIVSEVFLVSHFLNRLDRWFSRSKGFTLVIFGELYSLLFAVSQCSVLKIVLWSIMVYFYKLWLGWREVSLALIPHVLISIVRYLCVLSVC